MNNTHTIVIGDIMTPPYNKMFECCRRVYAIYGIAPTCNCNGGGHRETKILVEYD